MDEHKNKSREKQDQINSLNQDLVDLSQELDQAKSDLERAQEGRGRSPTPVPELSPARSLSPYSRAMAPPPIPTTARKTTVRSHSQRRDSGPTIQIHRHQREGTAATNTSVKTIGSVVVNPELTQNMKIDRTIKDPEKFDGKAGTFYQWQSAVSLKISNAEFKTAADGLRYVQSFLSGTPWLMTNTRIPSLGLWGKPCLDPYLDVDAMMQQLAERYGENNTEEHAATALEALKQGDRQDFNLFYVKYQEYQVYNPLPTEKAEAGRLFRKLNPRFRDKLSDGTEFTRVQDLVNRCTRLQTQYEALDADKKNSSSGSGSSSKKDDKKDGKKSNHRKYPQHIYQKKHQDLKPLTADDSKDLNSKDGCYRCREVGHKSSDRDKCQMAIAEDRYDAQQARLNHTEVGETSPAGHAHPPESGNGTATR